MFGMNLSMCKTDENAAPYCLVYFFGNVIGLHREAYSDALQYGHLLRSRKGNELLCSTAPIFLFHGRFCPYFLCLFLLYIFSMDILINLILNSPFSLFLSFILNKVNFFFHYFFFLYQIFFILIRFPCSSPLLFPSL